MTGRPVKNNVCPSCGGRLKVGVATIPFLLDSGVILIKNVPAEICQNCHEPYTTGAVTDNLLALLNQSRQVPTEISIINYAELSLA